MRFRFLLLLLVFLIGCDPGWDYRVTSTTAASTTTSTPVRLELAHASVFSVGLHTQVTVMNTTAAAIELESPAMTLRDAGDSTLTPEFLEGCHNWWRSAPVSSIGDVSDEGRLSG